MSMLQCKYLALDVLPTSVYPAQVAIVGIYMISITGTSLME